MKIRSIPLAFALAMALVPVSGLDASAASKADKLRLGAYDPAPEKIGKIDRDLSIRARLVFEKGGELASEVKKGQVIRLQVDYLGRDGAADRPVALVCSAQFIDTRAEVLSAPVKGKPCLDGRLQDSYGRYSGLNMSLKFRAEPGDALGTHGVVVTVADSVSGKKVVLVPTYRWLDGKP